VIVVDNASTDSSLDVVADLPLERIALGDNRGFGYGCNVGWRVGSSRYCLFLNPDARIDQSSIAALVATLDRDESYGAAAPRIVFEDGSLDFSLRRYPRLRSTFAQALFLHRLFPHAAWADEVIRDGRVYETAGCAEWVSGACVLVRRSLLEELGGFDEDFFLYCEDIDLCRRIWDSGYRIWYEPRATAVHAGGGSAPRASLLPRLAASRLRYADKHRGLTAASLERLGVALGALTHAALSRGGSAVRAGHLRSLRLVVSRSGDT
jgi:GT2 family glycosyltransferase